MFQKVLQIEESLLPANIEVPRFTNQPMYGNSNKWNHRGHTNTSAFDKNIYICIKKDGESSIWKKYRIIDIFFECSVWSQEMLCLSTASAVLDV